jgi:acetyl-CoA acetyltransferase
MVQMSRPTHRAAVVGVYNTPQARRLDGWTSQTLMLSAVQGALAAAGLSLDDVDGIGAAAHSSRLVHDLSVGPAWVGAQYGLGMVHEAVAAVENGAADVVVVVAADAGVYTDRAATAPWTRPQNEFVAPFGLFTAAEFALIARRHMTVHGTTPEQLATVAATIRNNGHVNPEAVYYGRGPFTPKDILASRMVADPFHLLDCSTTSEGGCALVVARADIERTATTRPVYLLGAASDHFGPAYQFPPSWDLTGRRGDDENGTVGARAARLAFAQAGLGPESVDVLELYDPFSFEIIRQLEAFGFCAPGEGGPFVADGNIAPTGRFPVTTDGGLMSFSHAGSNPQMLQRLVRAVQQLQGTAGATQVPDAHVALCSSGGAGALFTGVMLLGTDRT